MGTVANSCKNIKRQMPRACLLNGTLHARVTHKAPDRHARPGGHRLARTARQTTPPSDRTRAARRTGRAADQRGGRARLSPPRTGPERRARPEEPRSSAERAPDHPLLGPDQAARSIPAEPRSRPPPAPDRGAPRQSGGPDQTDPAAAPDRWAVRPEIRALQTGGALQTGHAARQTGRGRSLMTDWSRRRTLAEKYPYLVPYLVANWF